MIDAGENTKKLDDIHDIAAVKERDHLLNQVLRCLALGREPCSAILIEVGDYIFWKAGFADK